MGDQVTKKERRCVAEQLPKSRALDLLLSTEGLTGCIVDGLDIRGLAPTQDGRWLLEGLFYV